MIVIATGFIPLSAVRCFNNEYVEKQPLAWKEYCSEYWLKELQESIDRCTGCRNVTEILLKMALNTIQSIIQSKQGKRREAKILLCNIAGQLKLSVNGSSGSGDKPKVISPPQNKAKDGTKPVSASKSLEEILDLVCR